MSAVVSNRCKAYLSVELFFKCEVDCFCIIIGLINKRNKLHAVTIFPQSDFSFSLSHMLE